MATHRTPVKWWHKFRVNLIAAAALFAAALLSEKHLSATRVDPRPFLGENLDLLARIGAVSVGCITEAQLEATWGSSTRQLKAAIADYDAAWGAVPTRYFMRKGRLELEISAKDGNRQPAYIASLSKQEYAIEHFGC